MNKILLKLKTVAFMVTFGLLGAMPVLANQAQALTSPQVTIDSFADIQGIITRFTTWAFWLFFAAAVFFILWAGYDYLKGTDDGVKNASKKLKAAIIGIIIALVARSIPNLIQSLLAGQ